MGSFEGNDGRDKEKLEENLKRLSRSLTGLMGS
jgi:hypothetical protein